MTPANTIGLSILIGHFSDDDSSDVGNIVVGIVTGVVVGILYLFIRFTITLFSSVVR